MATMTARAMLRAEYGQARNFMTPYVLRVAKLGPHAAYELSTGRGLYDEPIYGVSVVLECDGETRRSPAERLSAMRYTIAEAYAAVDIARETLADPARFAAEWNAAR